jgi:hypothetical protein
VALDVAPGRLTVWRQLDLAAMQAPALEEAMVELLERAEWLSGEAAPARPLAPGPMLFFP